MGGIGRGGGFAGGVTGAHFTEYGPGVPGDQPGQATYDWNSDHHVGAWPGITGPLRAGDVALGLGAQQKYHVSPGQTFTDEYGRTWRFADRSGSKDPMNVDVFKGATGGIVKRATMGLIGEAGPEAVIPLSKAKGFGATINVTSSPTIHAGPGSDLAGMRMLLNEHARTIADEVRRIFELENAEMAAV